MMVLELETVKSLVPKGTRNNITEGLMTTINSMCAEDGADFAEAYSENFISYIGVLKSSKYRITDYMNAVKYVSYKLMENSNIDSYIMTFPDRYKRLREKYASLGSEEEIRAKITNYVTAYNKNELVNKILEQTLVPTHILNANHHQHAINVLVDLMMNATTDKVRASAADSVIQATRAPENSKIQVDIGLSAEAKEQNESVMKQMADFAISQKLLFTAGVPLEQAQKIGIVMTDQDDVTDAEIL